MNSFPFSNWRRTLADGVSALQIYWMQQYGEFNSEGEYTLTGSVPLWINQAQRTLGYLVIYLSD